MLAAEEAKQLATLRGHTSLILTVAFCPDGKMLAAGCTDRTVSVWDVSGILARRQDSTR